jgi:dCTP deaminase
MAGDLYYVAHLASTTPYTWGSVGVSIVPFVLDGEHRSVVISAAEFQACNGVHGDVVLIKQLDRAQLENMDDANATYDFCLGNTYRDHRDPSQTDLGPDDTLKLLPGMAVVVATEEEVHFPQSLFGVIVPKVSLLHEGVSNTTSKIDPGYNGRLYITIFNLGKKPIELKRGQKICSVFLLRVGPGARLYNKPSQGLRNQRAGGKWDRLRFVVEANGTWVQVVLTAVTIIAAIVTVISTLAVLRQPPSGTVPDTHNPSNNTPTRVEPSQPSGQQR